MNADLMTGNSMIEKEFSPPNDLNTSVLFLVFNRLDTTYKVFNEVKKAKPPRLYIASDGARESVVGEFEKVKEIRDYLISNIDWKCEVKTLFRDKNLGCKYAVSGAIDWFFENEEMGIILEDDCLPSQSFFWYCEELLEKYKFDDSIFVISGDNHNTEKLGFRGDYSYCKYPLIWGWATWSRVWNKYDVELEDWDNKDTKLINSISKYKSTNRFWREVFNKISNNQIDAWDYQLTYLLIKEDACCIVPSVNLITNIGFGKDATHTLNENSSLANRRNFNISRQLIHVSFNEDEFNKINDYLEKSEFRLKYFYVKQIIKNMYLEKIIRRLKKSICKFK